MTPDPTPLRPASQVVGGFFPVTLGGKTYNLRELPSRANAEWLASDFVREVRAKLVAVEPVESLDEVVVLMVSASEAMMDLVISYDTASARAWGIESVLPEREWIDTHATDRECYEAMRKVTDIAIPFARDLVTLVPEFIPALVSAVGRGTAAAVVALASSRSTSSAPPSTAGAPTTSVPTSPTPSSSTSTSTERPSVARRKRSRT